jgi:hypothetical protein
MQPTESDPSGTQRLSHLCSTHPSTSLCARELQQAITPLIRGEVLAIELLKKGSLGTNVEKRA